MQLVGSPANLLDLIKSLILSSSRNRHFFSYIQYPGGLVFIPQKHKTGARVKYNSGFFLTTNNYPDFGNERDCEAIKARLDIFQTSSLKGKSDTTVSRECSSSALSAFLPYSVPSSRVTRSSFVLIY